MTTYQYIAKTGDGKQVNGQMQAENETAVIRTLDDRDLFPVEVAEVASQTAAKFGGGKIRLRDLSVTYTQLADLLNAGVPLLRSLETLSRAMANKRLCEQIRGLQEDVSSGKTLADAMASRQKTFSSLHVAMVRAGEQGGFLEEALSNLGGFLERQDELRGKIRGAMIYPFVLMTIGTVAMIGMLIILVPKFKPFFQNIQLPLPTVVLFAASDLLVNHQWLLLGLVLLAVLGIRAVFRSESGALLWDRWRIRLPIVGKVIRTISVTRFCRILGTMLANGVPIIQALTISKDSTGSLTLSETVAEATEAVRAGDPLAAPLRASGLFPIEIIEMIAVAEESNQLEKVLVQVAETVERRVNRQVDAAVRLIEPLILVLIASMIGFVAVGMMYPIFTMSQTLK